MSARCCGSCSARSAWCCSSRAPTSPTCVSCARRAGTRSLPSARRLAPAAAKSRASLLSESVALGLLGGVLGVAVARGGLALLVWSAPDGLPRLNEIEINGVVLLFTLVISLLAGLLFGLIPVLRFGEPSVTALKEGGRSASEGPSRNRARNTLVVAEIALALVLLVVSGLMIRSFQAMRAVDPGFRNPEQVQTFRISVPDAVVADSDQAVRTHQQIAEQLARVPGVTSVGLSSAPSRWTARTATTPSSPRASLLKTAPCLPSVDTNGSDLATSRRWATG